MPKCNHVAQTCSGSNASYLQIKCIHCQEILYKNNILQVDNALLQRHVRRMEDRQVYGVRDERYLATELRDQMLANPEPTEESLQLAIALTNYINKKEQTTPGWMPAQNPVPVHVPKASINACAGRFRTAQESSSSCARRARPDDPPLPVDAPPPPILPIPPGLGISPEVWLELDSETRKAVVADNYCQEQMNVDPPPVRHVPVAPPLPPPSEPIPAHVPTAPPQPPPASTNQALYGMNQTPKDYLMEIAKNLPEDQAKDILAQIQRQTSQNQTEEEEEAEEAEPHVIHQQRRCRQQ